jgi:hypothetical protein
LQQFFEEIKGKFILASDLNALHYEWGSIKNYVEGKHIHQCVTEEEGQKGCLQEEFHAFCLETGMEEGINYFSKYYSKSTKLWFEAIGINRRVMVTINRLTSLKQSRQNRE